MDKYDCTCGGFNGNCFRCFGTGLVESRAPIVGRPHNIIVPSPDSPVSGQRVRKRSVKSVSIRTAANHDGAGFPIDDVGHGREELRETKMKSTELMPVSKDDREIHQKALISLDHYYKHKDSGKLTRMVGMLPNSNRRVAMLEWVHKFTVLHWDRNREVLVRKKIPEQPDLDGAKASPFWTFKVKQEQRRHVSGNTFDPNHFFDRVLADIRANIDRLSTDKLEHAIVDLQKMTADKRINAALKRSFRP